MKTPKPREGEIVLSPKGYPTGQTFFGPDDISPDFECPEGYIVVGCMGHQCELCWLTDEDDPHEPWCMWCKSDHRFEYEVWRATNMHELQRNRNHPKGPKGRHTMPLVPNRSTPLDRAIAEAHGDGEEG